MSDLVAVMRDGRIEQLDRPEIVYERPVSRYVASFVGAANLLDGTVERVDGDRIQVISTGFTAALPRSSVTTPGDIGAGTKVTLLIRPEHLLPSSLSEDSISLSGRVVERTYLGNRVHVRFQTEGGQSLLADARADDVADVGETFTAWLRPGAVAVLRTGAWASNEQH